jgi:hypothetical protein
MLLHQGNAECGSYFIGKSLASDPADPIGAEANRGHGVPCARSALGELLRLACASETVLLALLGARVARQESGLSERKSIRLWIGGEECA